MMQILIRACWWLMGCCVFFAVFAFTLNNRSMVTVHWFFGYKSQMQLVLLLLTTLVLGLLIGALAVLPSLWRQYRRNTQYAAAPAQQAKASAAAEPSNVDTLAAESLSLKQTTTEVPDAV